MVRVKKAPEKSVGKNRELVFRRARPRASVPRPIVRGRAETTTTLRERLAKRDEQNNVYWLFSDGKKDVTCQICKRENDTTFYDMKSKVNSLFGGAWGIMCPDCALKGVGVGKCGLGFGQRYDKQEDGLYLQTEGGCL